MLQRWVLPLLVLVFSLISILTLRSVAPHLVGRQIFFFVVGAGIFLFTSKIPYRLWERLGPVMYVGLIGFLMSTQVFGAVTRGTRSWIPLGSFHIQPSQMAVAIAGIFLAWWVARRPVRSVRSLLEFAILAGLPAVFISLEPDLGTTMIYLASLGALFFLSPTRTSYLASLVGIGVVAIVIAWLFLLKPYQKDRITSFLNVSENQSDAGYNAIQSVIAVGSGKALGRGIGQGVQSHLRFLPERQTDFVFASFAEEAGFLGSSVLISLYAFLVFFILWTGIQTQELSQRYFCIVTAAMLTVQAGINIGMNMALLPITGITLPLLSYGGSSILSLCFQYGCVQSIVHGLRQRPALHLR